MKLIEDAPAAIALSSDVDPSDPQIAAILRRHEDVCRNIRVTGDDGETRTFQGFRVPAGEHAAQWAAAQCPGLGSQHQVALVPPRDLAGSLTFLVHDQAGNDAWLVTTSGRPWKFAPLA